MRCVIMPDANCCRLCPVFFIIGATSKGERGWCYDEVSQRRIMYIMYSFIFGDVAGCGLGCFCVLCCVSVFLCLVVL